MACDTQMTHYSGMKLKGISKILELPEDICKDMFDCKQALIGFAGSTASWGAVVQYFAFYEEAKLPKLREIELLILTNKKEILSTTDLLTYTKIDAPFFSIGTGMHYAIGAMAAGKTPKEACMIASKYDPMTGMGYKEYHIT